MPVSDAGLLDLGHWYGSHHADPRAVALYLRHYSAKHYADGRPRRQFCAPTARMVLLTAAADAIFVWSRERAEYRRDGQSGVCCTIFRREPTCLVLASELIREACDLAWRHWPGQRLFTFVDARKVRHKRDPGRCFVRAGFAICGRSKSGLLILERLPHALEEPLDGSGGAVQDARSGAVDAGE